VKQELEEKLQETQCKLAKDLQAVMLLHKKELADAASAATLPKLKPIPVLQLW
jgi:hypothetical protein